MKRLLAALLALLFTVPALVLMGYAGAYQFLAPEIPEAAALRLVELVRPLVRAIVDGGAFLPANPMGLRPLR